MVGPSVPARRPFFELSSSIPSLVRNASDYSSKPVFQYSLAGGWPTRNSVVRLLASAFAVLCSFSFAFIAAVTSQRVARLTFCTVLLSTVVFAAIAAGCDLASIISVAKECATQNCRTEVPRKVLESNHVCICSVAGWFYFTLFADVVLLASAISCLTFTLSSMIKRRGVDPSY